MACLGDRSPIQMSSRYDAAKLHSQREARTSEEFETVEARTVRPSVDHFGPISSTMLREIVVVSEGLERDP
ncbi:hypothetical protein HZH68_003835 [Vespula germanica]|uniref:Uncharacterized protein n=1 Tax=Vespula germanica TaxID=30212 RepID=A0A836XMA7_VESGE|nr:hypothetical protein HZH68_003835 [Vespula germanica]